MDFLESRTENEFLRICSFFLPAEGERSLLAPCDAGMQGKLEQHRQQ